MKTNRKHKTINQILVTDSVIVTPDMKRKRRIYKFNFFLSSFVACLLFGICVYGEYDRSKSEQVSQDILLGLSEVTAIGADETTISVEEGVIVIKALADGGNDNMEVNVATLTGAVDKSNIIESIAPDGKTYYTEAVLKIPGLGIEYPVLSDTSDELLKISLNRVWGPEPNEVRKLRNCRTQL